MPLSYIDFQRFYAAAKQRVARRANIGIDLGLSELA